MENKQRKSLCVCNVFIYISELYLRETRSFCLRNTALSYIIHIMTNCIFIPITNSCSMKNSATE